ncbi:50S ribosomal protein L2 [Candidatus Bathyarchaeota archaeon]|nr:50S ribosomal protein L2 [Candidatus Bathyarchaeota archaeon]
MGKRIFVQRRGRRGSIFRALTHKRVSEAAFPTLKEEEAKSLIKGVVADLVHDPGRGTPLAYLKFEDGEECYIPAPEGISVGQEVLRGAAATVKIGNILPLEEVPEGTLVCNIELSPGDGGKLVKASGAYATVVSHTPMGTELKLPSGKSIYLDGRCRAMIGVVSGAGKMEKPFLKAGAKAALMASKGQKYPRVRGQAMIAASHPFGGGRHRHPGKPTTISRHAPPGRKVGLIAARRTGRGKKAGRGAQ